MQYLTRARCKIVHRPQKRETGQDRKRTFAKEDERQGGTRDKEDERQGGQG